jgi:hypothetical protein
MVLVAGSMAAGSAPANGEIVATTTVPAAPALPFAPRGTVNRGTATGMPSSG